MKYPKPTIRLLPTVAFVLAMSGAMVLQSCDDDSLIGQPSWLGNSIYERLQNEGNYTYTLRLIDDLGQTDVLNHTGSKTLFVADDDAYESFFKNNSWGVKSYSGLSLAKKKLSSQQQHGQQRLSHRVAEQCEWQPTIGRSPHATRDVNVRARFCIAHLPIADAQHHLLGQI